MGNFLYGVVCFLAGFLFGVIVEPVVFPCEGQLADKFSSDLIFQTTDTECLRIPESEEGYIWLCDNGYVEYDSTGVKFPNVAPRADE